eukprot:gene28081-31189_t
MDADSPPATAKISVAYKSVAKPMTPKHGAAWEELRKEARKIEGELDKSVSAYSKLCSGYEAAYKPTSDSKVGSDQVYRRLSTAIGAAKDRAKLMSGADTSMPHVTLQVDEVLSQATSVSTNLVDQRRDFDNIRERIVNVGARFPVVNGLLNAIRRKKSKDTLVLAGVIAGCIVFTLVYLAYK